MSKDFIPTAGEFAISMKQAINGDQEVDHIEMDQLMVDLLRQLGYDKAMDIYEAQHKWYA